MGRAFYFHSSETSASRIEGFTIKNGWTIGSGGGIYAADSNPIAANCVLVGNAALNRGGGMSGGTAINCLFQGNRVPMPLPLFGTGIGHGGGMYGGVALHCVFFGNDAHVDGGGMYGGTAVNCIFWSNTASSSIPNPMGFGYITRIPNNVSGAAVTYSDAQGGAAGTGNISADPLFVNAAAGDFHLSYASPCINAGTATALPPGVSLPATDIDGNPRIFGSAPDMGAVEYRTILLAKRSLVWQNNVTGDSVYWQMTGAHQTGGGALTSGVPANWKIVAYADITGDGQPDIIWQDSDNGDVAYWQMDKMRRVATGYLAQGVPKTWRLAAVADITGDGKPDLIWQNNVTGDAAYWKMNGVAFGGTIGYLAQGVPPVWRIAAAGDITGDGKADLIWQNSVSGDVVYWQMNGTQRVDGSYLSQGNGTLWRLAALCDVTGDGQNDLIWQNTANGDVKFWQMSGVTYSGTSGYMAQGVPTVWRVVGLN